MKVGYDHTIFARHRRGGISRYFCEIATRIGRTETVVVAAPLYPNLHLKEDFWVTQGIYVDLGWGTGTLADAVGRVLGPTAMGRTDILHETFYSVSSRYEQPLAGRVVTVHDMIHERFYPAGNVARWKKATIDRADLIICVSNKTRDDLLDTLNISESRVRVVHLGYELRHGSPRDRPPEEFPYLLHVGPRGEYKNFSFLLSAMSMSARLRKNFGLVCFGGPPLSKGEIRQIEDAGVSWFHQVTGDDSVLASYYQHAHALVMPSLCEGFGIPVLEAMSFGCPVCCSTGGALPEVAGEAAVFFDPKDAERCREVLERLAFDTDLRETMRERGYERVTQFGWDKCARETGSAYRELC